MLLTDLIMMANQNSASGESFGKMAAGAGILGSPESGNQLSFEEFLQEISSLAEHAELQDVPILMADNIADPASMLAESETASAVTNIEPSIAEQEAEQENEPVPLVLNNNPIAADLPVSESGSISDISEEPADTGPAPAVNNLHVLDTDTVSASAAGPLKDQSTGPGNQLGPVEFLTGTGSTSRVPEHMEQPADMLPRAPLNNHLNVLRQNPLQAVLQPSAGESAETDTLNAATITTSTTGTSNSADAHAAGQQSSGRRFDRSGDIVHADQNYLKELGKNIVESEFSGKILPSGGKDSPQPASPTNVQLLTPASVTPTEHNPGQHNLTQTPSAQSAQGNAPASPHAILRNFHAAGSPEWHNEVGNNIRWMGKMNISSAEIQLHPAELGSIEIKIHNSDDQTRISFITASQATRELIETSLPRLRELFSNNGLLLAETTVDSQQQDNSSAAGSRDMPARNTQFSMQDDTEVSMPELPGRASRIILGQVDYYA